MDLCYTYIRPSCFTGTVTIVGSYNVSLDSKEELES